VTALCSREDILLKVLSLKQKPDRKRPLGKSRHRREDNIKMDLQELGWGMDWIDLDQDRDRWRALVNAVVTIRVPDNAGNFLTSL